MGKGNNSRGEMRAPDPLPGTPLRRNPTPILRTKALLEGISASIFFICFSLLLLGFGAVVARKDKQIVYQPTWNTIHGISLKLGTIFPIVFAAVVGRAIRTFTAWRLEHGTRLAFVEQMMGSLTLGSALLTTYSLQALNILTAILAIIWAMSPLGSQAALLMITTEPVAATNHTQLVYFDTIIRNASSGISGTSGTTFIGSNSEVTFAASLNGLYNACLLQSNLTRNSNNDLWGNVKIPDIVKSQLTNGDDDWLLVGNASGIVYSSLLGIPISGLQAALNTTFHVETAYLSLFCQNITINDSRLPITNFGTNSTVSTSAEVSQPWINQTICATTPNSFNICLDGFYNVTQFGGFGSVSSFGNGTDFFFPARTLSFQTFPNTASAKLVAQCPITTVYVESSISCNGTNCTVVAMRPSKLPHPESNYTGLSFGDAFLDFGKALAKSVGQSIHASSSSTTEAFLLNPDQAGLGGSTGLDFTNIDVHEVPARLQQIINTYWYGSFNPSSTMGGFVSGTAPASNQTAAAVISIEHVRYTVHWKWLALFVVTAATMALCALVSLFLTFKVRGPDVLGYVSTTVANSEYIHTGRGVESVMGGAERARVYGSIRLRLMDVHSEQPVGFIAIAENTKGNSCRSLQQKDRKYY
ncbi:hypothetical protein T069G_08914 [Trichoderma breve]|uniref:Uncharacterized protein n=1 Tax=Trichoderma breve TaxID=2034170 RepID=A0A9W9E5M0_9HYPO|nr:hypothetical protein T069G_08914 [Trichoderma breve]KAJ4855546.1 hypothetical protein T069G_08914 [Trichoderma breve]